MSVGKRKKTEQNTEARNAALEAVPHKLPPLKREEKDGKLYVTVQFSRPGWQRLLGAGETCQRTFGLDAYGRRVYESCDGTRTVKAVIKRFSKATRISLPEAETAVTKFMRTLISKGLIAMAMDK